MSLLKYVSVILDLYPTYFFWLGIFALKLNLKQNFSMFLSFKANLFYFQVCCFDIYFRWILFVLKHEMSLFLTINSKTYIAIWQKFYNYYFACRSIKVLNKEIQKYWIIRMWFLGLFGENEIVYCWKRTTCIWTI